MITGIINRDKVIILIIHDLEDIILFADRVIVMNNGKIEKDFILTGTDDDKRDFLFKNVNFLLEAQTQAQDNLDYEV